MKARLSSPARPGGAGALGPDLPRLRRPLPAARGGPGRPAAGLRHLRHRRPAAAHEAALRRGPARRGGPAHPAQGALAHRRLEERRRSRPTQVKVPHHDLAGAAARDLYAKYQAALARAGAVDFGDLLVRPLRTAGGGRGAAGPLVRAASATCWWTSSRTPTRCSTGCCATWWAGPGTSAWWATTTRPSTAGAAPTCATSSASTRDFPGCRVVKLERNYRSTGHILDAAHAVISQGPGAAREEALDRGRPGRAPGAAGGAGRARRGGAGRPRGGRPSGPAGRRGDEIAVLYRTNAQSRAIEAPLRAARIPYVDRAAAPASTTGPR